MNIETLLDLCSTLTDDSSPHHKIQIETALRVYEAASLAYSKAWNEDDAQMFSIQASEAFNFPTRK